MTFLYVCAILTALSLLPLLYCAFHGYKGWYRLFKILASGLFVAAGFHALDMAREANASASHMAFARLLFTGLLFHAVGDVIITWRKTWVFLVTIGCFLLGHLIYFSAFYQLIPPHPLPALPALLFNLGFAYVLWARLGKLLYPGLVYAVAMSYMLTGAFTVLWLGDFPSGGLLFCAALTYNISDVAVVLDRYWKESPMNQLWGLPLYYGAQIMFIFTLVKSD